MCEVKNVRRGLGLDSDVSNQQRKVISANEMKTHTDTQKECMRTSDEE